MGQLESNYGMVDEFLAEGATLVGVFDRLLVADTTESETLDDDTDTFMVEVCHDDYPAGQIYMQTQARDEYL